MHIIGGGLVAQAFKPYESDLDDVVIFASGVSNSATKDPSAYQRERTLLYSTLQTCADDQRRVVYFSSGGAIYGQTNDLRCEDSPTYPTSDYGRHQIFCEGVIRNSGARHLIVRLPNLVGDSQNTAQLIPALVDQALSGDVTLFRHATRDLIDVDDFARLTVDLLRKVPQNELVTIASGISLPIEQIFNIIIETLGIHPKTTMIDKGDQQIFSIEKLQHLLGKPVTFDDDYPHRIIHKYAQSLVK